MTVMQSALRDANAFDAFIEIPLIGPLRDASSRQQSPEIPATMQRLFRAVFESNDSASRVRQVLPPPSHGTRRGRSAPSGWRPPWQLQHESSTVPLRENTSFLHGPGSPSQPLCLRKNTAGPGQLKEGGVNVTAAERFSATLLLRDHGPGLRKRLHFLRATFCSNLEFWHPHTTTLLGVTEFLQICGFGRQLAFRSHQRHFGRSA